MLTTLALLAVAAPARPNIILINADDLGVNDLHVYGRKDQRTPNLDRLASEGMRFSSAYCAQPICSPSRAALMTGKTPARLHLTTYLPGRPDSPAQKVLHPKMRMELPLEERTIAEILKDAGYATAQVGKWHLGNNPDMQGFDRVFAGHATTKPSSTEGGKGEYELTAEAETFITANRERPFFLYLAHNNPHIPFDARPDLVEKNAGSWHPQYAAVIETLDDSIGRVLRKIDELGLQQNTIFIFISDNGGLHVPEGGHPPPTHNTPFRAGKGFLYEGGLRVPLIIRWPGRIAPGKATSTPVINTDLLPTLLELAGIPVPAGLDGQSFARLLRGKGALPARPLYWHFPHYNNQGGRPGGAVREGNWKLVEFYDEGRVELYDLSRDIGETKDLAAQQAGRAKAMRAKLAAWRTSVGAQENIPNPSFDPALYGKLYRDVDVSRLRPEATAKETGEKYADWRKGMNAAIR